MAQFLGIGKENRDFIAFHIGQHAHEVGEVIGQVIGKTWMIVLALPIIWWIRRRDEKLGVVPE